LGAWNNYTIEKAWPAMQRFAETLGDCALDQPDGLLQGANNLVFFGFLRGQRAVFKACYGRQVKETEVSAIKLWSRTGFVPRLLDESHPNIYVMSAAPGMLWSKYLRQHGSLPGSGRIDSVLHEIGRGLRSLTDCPLTPELACKGVCGFPDVEPFMRKVLECGLEVHAQVDGYQDAFYGQSLRLIESQLEEVLNQPRILIWDDTSNVLVDECGSVTFIDFEATGMGTPYTQLGSALRLAQGQPRALEWLLNGFCGAGGDIRSLNGATVLAMAHFSIWLRIVRFLSNEPLTEKLRENLKARAERRRLDLASATAIAVQFWPQLQRPPG
jgi:hypothetical protein